MSRIEHHIPVLLKESIEYLITKPSGVYFDGTLGFGGHSSKILEKIDQNGKLICTDKDISAINYCKSHFKNEARIEIYNTSFTNINVLSKLEGGIKFDGIFADLGVSSFQLDDKDAGFSYRSDSPLDLRMNKTEGSPASEIVNKFSQEDIANILYKFGEEKNSRKIASKIVNARSVNPIKSTLQLKSIIEELVPPKFLTKTLSRVFQALRIYVNGELDDLPKFLEKAVDLLNPGGRLVLLTYHSLEDKIVKDFINYQVIDCICPPSFPVCTCDKEAVLKKVTRKPVIASDEEVEKNRRARSAKLRAAERI